MAENTDVLRIGDPMYIFDKPDNRPSTKERWLRVAFLTHNYRDTGYILCIRPKGNTHLVHPKQCRKDTSGMPIRLPKNVQTLISNMKSAATGLLQEAVVE